MQYIFDQANISLLFEGRLILNEAPDDGFMAIDDHRRELQAMPDNAVKAALLPRLEYCRAFAITEFTDRDPIIEQVGFELPDIIRAYRNVFSREPSPDVETDLRIIEVALNEGATLVTDDHNLRKLIELLDGSFVESAKFLTMATAN